RLAVFLRRLLDDARRQLRARRLTVPADLCEVIADVLLIEARLRASALVLVGRPEAAGVRRQALVDQDNLVVQPAELELGVGDDDPPLTSIVAAVSVDRQAAQRDGVRRLLPGQLDNLVVGDRQVVALGLFRRRREERLEKLLALFQTRG